MNKVHFLFGIHNHQPIGNFDFVFEQAYSQSYLPFLEAMERHPKVHWNLHATGILWEWLDRHHPEYVERVVQQVREGRVEILTGGYYEPILPALPDVDKAGQIQKLSRYIRQRFKVKPKGMWLAERVWEPQLAKVLSDNGVEYTLLDDTHFSTTGLPDEDLCGSFLTEEQGATVQVLPIRQDLRYAIPFKDPGETLNLLRRYATPSGHRALVMFDDGEKFGLWPDTHNHVYRDGWLERFLTVLESNSDWISCSRVSDYLADNVPQGRVYLPTASYHEMGEWSLPPIAQEGLSELQQALAHQGDEGKRAKRFIRGGFWRNFLTKYEEANTIHKKMLHVSQKVHKAVGQMMGPAVAKPSAKAQKMLDDLWAGQCNCAYWHGVFGGLYLPHLRQALFKELLSAERQADKVLAQEGVTIVEQDFDKDGRNEVLIESPEQNVYLSPHNGGSLFEWDLRAEGVNLVNVLTRRPEAYHKKLVEFAGRTAAATVGGSSAVAEAVRVKEQSLETRLHTDWYRRVSLLDHFLHPTTDLDNFFRCQYGEQGDFIRTAYRVDIVRDRYPQVRLSRTGTVWTGDQKNAIAIEKTLSLVGAKSWQVNYRIENVQGAACDLWFGSEMAFAFSTQDQPEPVEHLNQSQWARRDQGFDLVAKVTFDVPTDLWEFPLQTVSLSEAGFERTYQGTVLLAHMRFRLQPGQSLIRTWRVGVPAS